MSFTTLAAAREDAAELFVCFDLFVLHDERKSLKCALYRLGTLVAEELGVFELFGVVPLEEGASLSEKYVLVSPASRYVTLKSMVRFPSKSLPSSSLKLQTKH